MNTTKTILGIMMLMMMCVACEKPNFDGDDNEVSNKTRIDLGDVPVNFSLGTIEQGATHSESEAKAMDNAIGTRAQQELGELCARLDFAVYKLGAGNKNKLAEVNQTSDKTGFGTVSMSLNEGEYVVVAIAHNGKGKATMTNPRKITFPDNKVTDTFYFIDTINVKGEAINENMNMRRAVAKVTLRLTDELPSEFNQWKFHYTGGSSTFDAVAGNGCVRSRQTEYRSAQSNNAYEVYTFPRSDSEKLNMEVCALDKNDNTLRERTFEPRVMRNVNTEMKGAFFDNNKKDDDEKKNDDDEKTEDGNTFHFVVDNADWEVIRFPFD